MEHLVILSLILYDKNKGKIMEKWCLDNLATNKKKRRICKNYKMTSRRHMLITLKYLIKNYNNEKTTKKKFSVDMLRVFKVVTLINNFKVESENIDHSLINASLIQYRDNYLLQLHRSVEIFIKSPHLKKYRILFEEFYKISIKDYIFSIYDMVLHYDRCISKYNYEEIVYSTKWFIISNRDTNNHKVLKKVLDIISFDIYKGKEFSNETMNDYFDFSLFRDKPLLNIDNKYFPVDGAYFEDLLFNNLFYKIDSIPNESDFKNLFGKAFEEYVQNLVSLVCNSDKYEYIEEFSFIYKKNKLKSPDAIILNKEQNSVLVIEVKSSRVLNTVTINSNNEASIKNSFKKTKLNPLSQAYRAISRIIKSGSHPDLTLEKQYILLSVSMSDIFFSRYDFRLKHPKDLNDDTPQFFYSMNLETFELLIKILSSDFTASFGDIFNEYNNKRYNEKVNITLKNFLSRIIRDHNIESSGYISQLRKSQSLVQGYFSER